MILIFISLLIALGSVNLFSISYKISGVNRAVIFAPLEIFEVSVPITNEEKYGQLIYDKNLVKNKYAEYLDSVIYQYVDDYNINYSFYSQNDDMVYEKYDGVDITISTKINNVYPYSRTMFYEIYEANNG